MENNYYVPMTKEKGEELIYDMSKVFLAHMTGEPIPCYDLRSLYRMRDTLRYKGIPCKQVDWGFILTDYIKTSEVLISMVREY